MSNEDLLGELERKYPGLADLSQIKTSYLELTDHYLRRLGEEVVNDIYTYVNLKRGGDE